MAINLTCILLAGVACAVVQHVYRLAPTPSLAYLDLTAFEGHIKMSYGRPYTHMGSYGVGIAAGYLLATRPKLRLTRLVRIVGWTVAIAINLAVLYGSYPWHQGRLPSHGIALLYGATARTIWAIGVAWVVTVCTLGYGGIVNNILSWNGLVPISRMSYMAYLIHPVVQVAHLGQLRTQHVSSRLYMVYTYFGHLVMTMIVAYGLTILLEAPVMNLNSLVFGARSGKDDAQKPTDGRRQTLDNSICLAENPKAATTAIPHAEEKPGLAPGETGSGVDPKEPSQDCEQNELPKLYVP